MILESLHLIWRILTFTATEEELDKLGARHLIVGLPLVWLVGLGRWWDEPRDISILHRSGLGSIVYVLLLSTLLYLIAAPLARQRFDLFKMMAFVCFTAPPAALYALPVEMWMDRQSAVMANIAFLSIVSIYRVSLLIWFYLRGLDMDAWHGWIAGLLPIAGIAVGLTFAGFAEQMIEIMGGIREQSAATEAYVAVSMISCMSIWLAPVLLIAWGFAVARVAKEKREESGDEPKVLV